MNYEKQIWDTLISMGFSEPSAGGIMGNIYAESACIPNNVQNSGNRRTGLSDEEYTDQVDNGTYKYTNSEGVTYMGKDAFISDSIGYGLCQWTYWSRKQNLYDRAKEANKSIADIGIQLNLLSDELKSYGLINQIKQATNMYTVCKTFLCQFERPASVIGKTDLEIKIIADKRFSYASVIYDKYATHPYDYVNMGSSSDITGFESEESYKKETVKLEAKSTGQRTVLNPDNYARNTQTSETVEIDNSSKKLPASNQGSNLLSFPTLVETPFIIATIGDYTFGDHSIRKTNNIVNTTFPNFMQSMEITKINGEVNTYTLVMEYKISAGDDPNLLDKVFSSVSSTRKIKLSYGDWSAPSFIYKEESGIISKISSNIDFGGSKITYTLSCISDGYSLKGNKQNFPAKTNVKPSTLIIDLLYDSKYRLLDTFTGMQDRATVMSKGWIPTDDKPINLEAKTLTDPLTYINYLVGCMSPASGRSTGNLNSAKYYLTVMDDSHGEFGGTYFKISKVPVTNVTADTLIQSMDANTTDTYVLDIGYPGDNFVTQFQLKNNDAWSILYNYSENISNYNKSYTLDNNGNMITTNDPNIMTSSKTYQVTESLRGWWTQVTQFPIQATVVLKGLLRPAMLMSYVRINSYFYGKKHISSGLYIITKQVDKISSSGYTTTLSLLRVAGDSDYDASTSSSILYI